jgi:hypothetical protein
MAGAGIRSPPRCGSWSLRPVTPAAMAGHLTGATAGCAVSAARHCMSSTRWAGNAAAHRRHRPGRHGRQPRVTPVEALHLATFLASVYPSVRVREEPPLRTWHALLADVDAVDALMAVIRLARRRRDIALSDICAEAHRIREERLTRHPEPDSYADGPGHFRASLPEVVIATLSLRVPCPWCGAAVGQPCTLPGGATSLRRTVAHPARIIAVGLAERDKRGAQHVR